MSRKKMKKVNILLLGAYLIGSVAVISLFASFINNKGIDIARTIGQYFYFAGRDKNTNKKLPQGQNLAQMNLRPQNPDTGEIINGEANGRLEYNLAGSTLDLTFTGNKLKPNNNYTLIYFPENSENSWPRQGTICLGSGISDSNGLLTINSTSKPGNLPKDYDLNYQRNGAQINLINTNDVRCQGIWDISGNWKIDFYNDNIKETHSAYLIQSGAIVTGSGGFPADDIYTKTWKVAVGMVNLNVLDLDLNFNPVSGCLLQMEGKINDDGTMSGVWDDQCNPELKNLWKTVDGKAVFKPAEMFNNNKADYLYSISLINYQETL